MSKEMDEKIMDAVKASSPRVQKKALKMILGIAAKRKYQERKAIEADEARGD